MELQSVANNQREAPENRRETMGMKSRLNGQEREKEDYPAPEVKSQDVHGSSTTKSGKQGRSWAISAKKSESKGGVVQLIVPQLE